MSRAPKCESCGMPMTERDAFGGGDPTNRYCCHCTYPDGKLKPRHEVREGMINYIMAEMKKSREEAEAAADAIMSDQPAWRQPR